MTSTERDLPEDKLRERLLGIVAGPNPALTPRQRVAIRDAAAALASIRAERDAAVAALKPFADFISDCGDELPDEMPLTSGSPFARKQVTVADFRRAARAIAGEQKNDA